MERGSRIGRGESEGTVVRAGVLVKTKALSHSTPLVFYTKGAELLGAFSVKH